MKIQATFIALLTTTSALVIHTSSDEASKVSKRGTSYQLGVSLFQAGDCSGPQALPDRNHDEHSCNSATENGPANSAFVKTDGTARGTGCMTVYESGNCQGRSASYTLTGGQCVNFDSITNGFRAGCIVVGGKDGDCGTVSESCWKKLPPK